MIVGAENKERIAIIQDLRDIGCCSRCILRLLGEKVYSHYITSEQVLKRLSELGNQLEYAKEQSNSESLDTDLPSPPAKRLCGLSCISCLNLLKDLCDDNTLEKIKKHIADEQLSFLTFVIQLSIPVTIDLRERLLFLYLQEKHQLVYGNVNIEDLPTSKDVWKWVIGSQLGKNFQAEFSPSSSFQIAVNIQHTYIEQECQALEKLCPDAFPNRRKKEAKPEIIYTRTAVHKAFSRICSETLKTIYILPPSPSIRPCYLNQITCTHSPLYLAGRYNKYSRQLSQTPWIIDGEKRVMSSVQELIVDVIKEHIKATKIIFSASGREDVDVRMLGSGRPFVLEFINPKVFEITSEILKEIQMEINNKTDDILVRDLQMINKDDVQKLKEGEEEKKKSYCAKCCINRKLTSFDIEKLCSIKDLTLKQKTPIRVLHRRPLAMRERIIHSISASILSDVTFELHLVTQAGTYVKEFVHGDFGRTVPNLGSLLEAEIDIIELDVERIDLDWPPTL